MDGSSACFTMPCQDRIHIKLCHKRAEGHPRLHKHSSGHQSWGAEHESFKLQVSKSSSKKVKMNREPSYELYHNVAIHTEEDMLKVDSTGTNEFDVYQNYSNAVDCLIHYEHIIETLQEKLAFKDVQMQKQLVVKDEKIAGLSDRVTIVEAKLVSTSLKLASAKAIEDEHQLLKRRISSGVTDNEEQHTTKKVQGYSNLVSFRGRSKDRSASDEQTRVPRKKLQRSLTAMDTKPPLEAMVDCNKSSKATKDVDFLAWPTVQEQNNEAPEAACHTGRGEHEGPKRRSGFRLPGLTNRISCKATTLNDIDKDNMISNSRGFYSAGSHEYSGNSIDGSRSISDTNLKGRRQGTAPLLTRNELTPDNWSTQRRLFSFGQLILGSNSKNKEANKAFNKAARAIMDEHEDCPPGHAKSSCSEIPGVIFPVSFEDCLAGLTDDDSKSNYRKEGSFGTRNVKCLRSSNANAEWSEFR